MSTLTSTSTLAQIKAAYLDNASYTEDNDVTKARAFVTACRFLLLKIPQRASHGGTEEIWMDTKAIHAEMTKAEAWLGGRDDRSGAQSFVKFASVENFRS